MKQHNRPRKKTKEEERKVRETQRKSQNILTDSCFLPEAVKMKGEGEKENQEKRDRNGERS